MNTGLRMLFHSGKNPKWKYYAAAALRNRIPASIYRRRLASAVREWTGHPELRGILDRVNYYCRDFTDISATVTPADIGLHPELARLEMATTDTLVSVGQKVYYYDTQEFARMFPRGLRMNLLPGDIYFDSPVPALVKSRPIDGDNLNSVLFKLNKVRHFVFYDDRIPFRQKLPQVLFRGKVNGKPNRIAFMERYFGVAGFDLGAIDRHPPCPGWRMPKLTLGQQLHSGIVVSLEGNDVASNLKWLMASNSLVFTPKLHCESWFMEGRLRAGVHYVELADDFSDIKEKADYYFSHPGQAEEIIRNANAYAAAFRDKHREYITEILTMGKYLTLMNPGADICPGLSRILGLE